MPRAILAGLTITLAVGGPTLKAYAQDPSARCVSVANEQMTIDSAQGRGLYIFGLARIGPIGLSQGGMAALGRSTCSPTTLSPMAARPLAG
jgi:hypothetical protein